MRSVWLPPHETRIGRCGVTLHYPETFWERLTIELWGPGERHVDGLGRSCRIEWHELREGVKTTYQGILETEYVFRPVRGPTSSPYSLSLPPDLVGPVRQCDDPDAYYDDVVQHDDDGDWRTCTRCKPPPCAACEHDIRWADAHTCGIEKTTVTIEREPDELENEC